MCGGKRRDEDQHFMCLPCHRKGRDVWCGLCMRLVSFLYVVAHRFPFPPTPIIIIISQLLDQPRRPLQGPRRRAGKDAEQQRKSREARAGEEGGSRVDVPVCL